MPFIPPVIGDPNETTPHTDAIREKLLLAMQDESLPRAEDGKWHSCMLQNRGEGGEA